MMATGTELHIDSIFQALGPLGKFTKIQIVLIWIGFFPTGTQLLSNVFIGLQVSHRCSTPENETVLLNDFTALPNVSIVYEECAIRLMSNTTAVREEECLFGTEYELPKDTSFISQFDLVCESKNLARLTQTLVICGQSVGAVMGALLADRLGRKTVVVASHIGLFVSGMAVAYSPNFVMFAVVKLVVGAFQQAIVATNATLLLELMITTDRRLACVFCGCAWASSVILLDLLAFAFKDYSWRTLQMIFTLVSVPSLLNWWFLRESLRWLMANGKTKEAVEHVKYVAGINGTNPEDIQNILESMSAVNNESEVVVTNGDHNIEDVNTESEFAVANEAHNIEDVNKRLPKASEKLSYLDLFRNRHLLFNTLIMWIAWFTTALGFFAIYLTSASLSGDRFLNFFLTALMEFPSNIFFYFGLNRYGRKIVLLCLFTVLSVGLIGSGIFRSLEQTMANSALALVFSMIAMCGASGCFGILFQYTPELFPTNIRNQALGISSLIARIGGMMAPFTGLLSEKAMWGPGLLIGCLASIVAVLTRFLPETRGKELPQTLEDLNAWFVKDDKNVYCGNDKEKEENNITI